MFIRFRLVRLVFNRGLFSSPIPDTGRCQATAGDEIQQGPDLLCLEVLDMVWPSLVVETTETGPKDDVNCLSEEGIHSQPFRREAFFSAKAGACFEAITERVPVHED